MLCSRGHSRPSGLYSPLPIYTCKARHDLWRIHAVYCLRVEVVLVIRKPFVNWASSVTVVVTVSQEGGRELALCCNRKIEREREKI